METSPRALQHPGCRSSCRALARCSPNSLDRAPVLGSSRWLGQLYSALASGSSRAVGVTPLSSDVHDDSAHPTRDPARPEPTLGRASSYPMDDRPELVPYTGSATALRRESRTLRYCTRTAPWRRPDGVRLIRRGTSLPWAPRTRSPARAPRIARRSQLTRGGRPADERVRAVPASHPTLSSSATGNSEPRNTSEASQCPTQERRLGSARSLGGSLPRRLVPHIPTELADAPSDRRSQLRKLARSKVDQDDEQTAAQPPGLPQTVDHVGTATRAALSKR